MSPPPGHADDDRPVSVQLGQVVAPEDAEDWTRPLTWVAALGMLAGPLVALAWLLAAAPATGAPQPLTWLLAAALAGGAVTTGATQRGRWRAFSGTLGAALFGALATVAVAVALAGERQAGAASPAVDHALAAALAGTTGALAAAPLMALFADSPARTRLTPAPLGIGIGVSALVVRLVLPG